MKRLTLGLALLPFLAVSQPEGAAALVPTPNCNYWMGVRVLNQFVPTAAGCLGTYRGNDKHHVSEVQSAIAGAWGGSSTYMGSAKAGRKSGPFSSVSRGPRGSVTFDSPLSGDYVLVLKAANRYSLYYFPNLVEASRLQYSTRGANLHKKRAPRLQQVSLYKVSRVPEPGTLLLLGTGLVGLGIAVLLRRKDQLA